MKILNCVVIDDHRLERMLLEEYISKYSYLKIAASFQNPVESLDFIRQGNTDLLFIDVDMPLMSGIELLKSLSCPPPCIFVTVHPEYAIDAFDIQAIDYLLKPVNPDRLDKAIHRTLELFEIKDKATQYSLRLEKDFLMIKEGTTVSKVYMHEIIYLEALTNYTKIVTGTRNYITLNNLKNFLDELPKEKFLRIHRSYAVAIDKIKKFSGSDLQIEKHSLPLGKTYRHDVKKILNDI
jgi:two-component system LytT family response regulator